MTNLPVPTERRPLVPSLALVVFGAVLSGCGVGSGNTLGQLTIHGDSSQPVFHCFYTQLLLIGEFTHGGLENDTSRATWASSNPGVVAVSNGDLKTPDGATIARGTLVPIGNVGQSAQIKASFAGLTSNTITVTIEEARLELFPARAEVAEGTKTRFLATSVLGNETNPDRVAVTDPNLALFESDSESVASIDASGLVTTNGPGTTTITAHTNMAASFDSNGNAIGRCAAGVANPAATLVVHDGPLQGIEIKAINDGSTPATIPPLVSQAFAAKGKYGPSCDPNIADDPNCFIQDITGQSTFKYLQSNGCTGTPPCESPNHTSIFATSVAGDVAVSATFPDSSATSAPFTLTVEDTTLSGDPVLAPDSAHMLSGTALQYLLSGGFLNGKTYDLTLNTLWTSSDLDIAQMFTNGVVVAPSDSDGTVTITAKYTKTDTTQFTGTTTLSTGATLSILSVSQPTDPAPFANTGPFQSDPGCNTSGQAPVNVACRLKASAQLAEGGPDQDITANVVWSSSDPTTVSVSNASGFNGIVTGLQAGGPVTITAQHGATTATFDVTVPP